MGLFGKLFEKKECSVCGGEIGLLGNRKLEDGNLCKNCANKLSPFFSERRHSTVEEIKQQLAYREENARELANFSSTRSFGFGYKKIHIDQGKGKFILASGSDWRDDNPDIINLSQINSVNIDIDENRSELYTKDNEGRSVSYNPPRYEYSYRFYIEISVNSPYFDEIRFELSDREAESPYSPIYQECEREAYALQQALTGVATPVNNQNNFGGQQMGGFNNQPNNGFNNPQMGGFGNQQNNGFNNNQMGGFNAQTVGGAFVGGAAMGNMGANFVGNQPRVNWTCECGMLNQSPFCQNCGKQKTQYSPYKCDKCGWELQSMNVPNNCPVCGDPIDADDIN